MRRYTQHGFVYFCLGLASLMKPKWQKLASLAQEICTLWFQFCSAVFASKGYPFKNILGYSFLVILAQYGPILSVCFPSFNRNKERTVKIVFSFFQKENYLCRLIVEEIKISLQHGIDQLKEISRSITITK